MSDWLARMRRNAGDRWACIVYGLRGLWDVNMRDTIVASCLTLESLRDDHEPRSEVWHISLFYDAELTYICGSAGPDKDFLQRRGVPIPYVDHGAEQAPDGTTLHAVSLACLPGCIAQGATLDEALAQLGALVPVVIGQLKKTLTADSERLLFLNDLRRTHKLGLATIFFDRNRVTLAGVPTAYETLGFGPTIREAIDQAMQASPSGEGPVA